MTDNPKAVVRDTSKLVRGMPRSRIWRKLIQVGLIIRGLLYLGMGLFGILSIFDLSKSPQNPNQLIDQVKLLPFGKILLAGIVTGLVGYALWGFVRVFINENQPGSKIKRGITSAGYLVSAVSYLLLALPAVQILVTSSNSAPINPADVIQKVFSVPFGGPSIVLVGMAVIVSGLGQLLYSGNKYFKDDLDLGKMKKKQKKFIDLLGQYGYFVRGLVFIILGVFLAWAGLSLQTTGPLSYAGVLQFVSSLIFGPMLLGIVSLGLGALGLYSIISVKWAKLG